MRIVRTHARYQFEPVCALALGVSDSDSVRYRQTARKILAHHSHRPPATYAPCSNLPFLHPSLLPPGVSLANKAESKIKKIFPTPPVSKPENAMGPRQGRLAGCAARSPARRYGSISSNSHVIPRRSSVIHSASTEQKHEQMQASEKKETRAKNESQKGPYRWEFRSAPAKRILPAFARTYAITPHP